MLTVGSSHPEEERVNLPNEKIVKSTSSDLIDGLIPSSQPIKNHILYRPRITASSAISPLDLIPSSPKENPSTPSSLSLKSSTSFLPLRELLLLSPSPSRKSRTRLADRDEMTEEGGCEQNGSRRRCKSKGS
ncbi:RETICULON-LIKE PROTEIN B17 [Salix viminalis]|uniref:RETICULON-LIKE PROTEIN B17 n=1 Tax=Salix viminalis TaxID=40686 RepID=A0A9Q0NVR7_SALVM|nr:RETICULON-LIKE PROTEIN B17 [Salix viminalis]